MTFDIPKDMEFEEISPRKGSGSVSAFRKTVRCAIYVWNKTNVRLAVVIGSDIATLLGLKSQSPVQVQVGVSNDIVLATYQKGTDPKVAYYTAKSNGSVKYPKPYSDLRIMTTLDKHLLDYFKVTPVKYITCEHMMKDKSVIVRIHKDLLSNPDDPQQTLGF